MQTYYYIYKTTNVVNNKIYIGKHKSKDLDNNYLGSGKILQLAVKKYGEEKNLSKKFFMYLKPTRK